MDTELQLEQDLEVVKRVVDGLSKFYVVKSKEWQLLENLWNHIDKVRNTYAIAANVVDLPVGPERDALESFVKHKLK